MSVSERIKALAVMLAALTGAGVFGTLSSCPNAEYFRIGLVKPFAGLWGWLGGWMVGPQVAAGQPHNYR